MEDEETTPELSLVLDKALVSLSQWMFCVTHTGRFTQHQRVFCQHLGLVLSGSRCRWNIKGVLD